MITVFWSATGRFFAGFGRKELRLGRHGCGRTRSIANLASELLLSRPIEMIERSPSSSD